MKPMFTQGSSTMDYLERRLQRLINKNEGNSIVAQSIRQQIEDRDSGQSAQEKYLIGMVQRLPSKEE
jgi:hypothetical protein